jgi:hypothetical protein
MNKPLLLLLASLTALSYQVTASQSAQIRLFCLSLRFAPATADVLGQRYTLEIGTAEGSDGLNGELTPIFDDSLPSHGTSFRLTDPSFPEPMTGDLVMNVPTDTDANANGFPDFFEVSQAVSTARTTGLFAGGVDDGNVSATWSRAADSSVGVCRLKLTSRMFGELPEFTAQFELIEYTGPIEYVPNSANVDGTIHLVQTGTPANTLDGQVRLVRSATNRFDEVNLAAGAWTNASAQTLVFTNTIVFRDTGLRTNYYGFIDFDDGDLKTSAADYLTWQLSIDDANDLDHDGIPDFTDDPIDENVERPTLRISVANDRPQLEINGQVGKTYEVEETASLREINWGSALAVTLTNRIQTVELPVAGKSTVFWRVKAR